MKKFSNFLPCIAAIILLLNTGGNSVYARNLGQRISPASESPAGTIERITQGINGTESECCSDDASISADGRFVAFSSSATNLIENDNNHSGDIFVHDRSNGTLERVSVASDGTPGIGGTSFNGKISANGRFVAFFSWNTNLVEDDSNGLPDIFVHDRQTGTTEVVSISSEGMPGNNAPENWLSISADGRYVAFGSKASNLVEGDTNSRDDIFVHDRQTGITERVSIASDGSQSDHLSRYPAISANGQFVAFHSYASNLVSGDTVGLDVFVHDRLTGITENITFGLGENGNPLMAGMDSLSVSGDGRFIAFSGVGYVGFGLPNVFVYDRQSHTLEIVSVATDGTLGNGGSYEPSISADGRFVAFSSTSYNLAPGGVERGFSQLYLRDRMTGTTERISNGPEGSQGDNGSSRSFISPGGGYVAFISAASNLLNGDTNDTSNVYVYNRIVYQPPVYSITGLVTLADDTPLQDVIVAAGDHQTITDANGLYTLNGLVPGQYTLTPSLDDYTFSPPILQVDLSSTNLAGQNFTAIPVTYTLFASCIYNQ